MSGSELGYEMKAGFTRSLGAAFAVGVATLGLAGPVGAVTVTTQEPNFSEMLYNNGGADSASMQMFSKPGFYLVDVTSSETLAEAGGGSGHAWLAPADGSLSDITFAPSTTPAPGMNLFDSFDVFGVKVSLINSIGQGSNKVNFASYTYDVMFSFTNAADLTITLPGSYLADLPNSGQTNFYTSGTEGAFTSIKFFNVKGYTGADQTGEVYTAGFANFKQPSFDVTGAVVPEPSTWAMMIIGFGGVGALMRRRRTALA